MRGGSFSAWLQGRPARVLAIGAAAAVASLVGCAPTPSPSPSPSAAASREATAAPPTESAGSVASAAAPEADAATLALVAPLHPGAEIAGYSVVRIQPVRDGTFGVVCKSGAATVRLDVALASPGAPPPPAQTQRFAVYYAAHEAPPEDGEKLALALAKLLEANAAAPAPSGLAPFTPHAAPGTEL